MHRTSLVALATGLAALTWAPPQDVSAPAPASPRAAPAPVVATPAPAIPNPAVVLRASDPAPRTPAAVPAPASPRGLAQGMTIHLDPATGKPITPAADDLQSVIDASISDLNTSSKGLVEVESPVKGGGTMVRLEGRFMHTMVQGIGPDGTPQSTCGSHTSTAAAAARED
jgi:hypothetical protein